MSAISKSTVCVHPTKDIIVPLSVEKVVEAMEKKGFELTVDLNDGSIRIGEPLNGSDSAEWGNIDTGLLWEWLHTKKKDVHDYLVKEGKIIKYTWQAELDKKCEALSLLEIAILMKEEWDKFAFMSKGLVQFPPDVQLLEDKFFYLGQLVAKKPANTIYEMVIKARLCEGSPGREPETDHIDEWATYRLARDLEKMVGLPCPDKENWDDLLYGFDIYQEGVGVNRLREA